MSKHLFGYAIVASLISLFFSASAAKAEELNIYSHRQPQLLQPIIDGFTKKTGIKTNVIFAKEGLIERIAAEGVDTPADIFLTVDVGLLQAAEAAGIAGSIAHETLARVPENLKDNKSGNWVALSMRSRVIYASNERVTEHNLDYADLASPAFKGRLCTRSGQHVYTNGLIASIIAHEGEEAARNWLTAVRDNLARAPKGNDRAQVAAIFAGECDIALGNTYYMGRMQTNDKQPEQKEWAKSVRIIFPNKDDRGSHINVSGAVITKHAKNSEAAQEFVAYALSDEAQKLYAEINFEYPVMPSATISERVAGWGTLKADDLDLSRLGDLRASASILVDTINFDAGPQ